MARWLFVFSLVACTGTYKPPADTLVVGLSSMPSTLDPRHATDANGMRVGGLIFESLVHVGAGFKPEAEAAESWTHKNNVISFRLRPDLIFHNGRRATPEDILFSFDYYRGPKSPFASTLKVIEDVKAEEKDGRLLVHIRTAAPLEKFLITDLPSVKILPKKEILELGADFNRHLIGSGPFRFGKVDLNEVRLESARAHVPYLKFKIVRDDFTRFQKLLKGELDFVQADLPNDKVAEFEKRPGEFQVFRYPGITMTYILINFKDPWLQKKWAREVLAQALDREAMIRYKLSGLAVAATSILTPANPFFNAALKNAAFDPQRALAAVREKGAGGRLVLKTSNSPQAIDNGKVLVNQFGAAGLKIDLESYEWGTFYQDIRRGNFQLATMRWVGSVDPDIYRMAFHSAELPPGRNRGSYVNAELDRLLDQAARVTGPAERKRLYDRVQQLVHDDIAILPLWYDEQVAVASKRVLNFKPALNSGFLPLAQVEKREP